MNVIFVIFVSFISIRGDPCTNYSRFPSEDRRDRNYIISSKVPTYALSDRFLRPGWYGSVLNITKVLPPHHACGATYPIWTKEVHENDNGILNLTMCVNARYNCTVKFFVKAKKCDSVTVYDLPYSPSDAAYCLEPQANVPLYDKTPHVEIVPGQKDKLANVFCRFDKHEKDVFYTVFWVMNDTFCYNSKRHKWSEREENSKLNKTALIDDCIYAVMESDATLDLDKHTYRSRFNISCGVRASYVDMPGGSVPVFSDFHFFSEKDYCVNNTLCIVQGSVCQSPDCQACKATPNHLLWSFEQTVPGCGPDPPNYKDYCLEDFDCYVFGAICPSPYCLRCEHTSRGLQWNLYRNIENCTSDSDKDSDTKSSVKPNLVHMSVLVMSVCVAFLSQNC